MRRNLGSIHAFSMMSAALAGVMLAGAGCGGSSGADTPEALAERLEEAYNEHDASAYADLFDLQGERAENLDKLLTRQTQVEQKGWDLADALEDKYKKDAKPLVAKLRESDVFTGLHAERDAEFKYDEDRHVVAMRGKPTVGFAILRRDGVYYLQSADNPVLDDKDQMKKTMEKLDAYDKLADKAVEEVDKQEYWDGWQKKYAEHEREILKNLDANNRPAPPPANNDNPNPTPPANNRLPFPNPFGGG